MLGETDARGDDTGAGESSAVDGNAAEGVTAPSAVPAGRNETREVPAGQNETREVPAPPVTGDEAVDDAMAHLAESQAGSFAERIEAGEHAHRSLQSRLGGLGGA